MFRLTIWFVTLRGLLGFSLSSGWRKTKNFNPILPAWEHRALPIKPHRSDLLWPDEWPGDCLIIQCSDNSDFNSQTTAQNDMWTSSEHPCTFLYHNFSPSMSRKIPAYLDHNLNLPKPFYMVLFSQKPKKYEVYTSISRSCYQIVSLAFQCVSLVSEAIPDFYPQLCKKQINIFIFLFFRYFVPNILILKETSTVELFFLQARILIFKVRNERNKRYA